MIVKYICSNCGTVHKKYKRFGQEAEKLIECGVCGGIANRVWYDEISTTSYELIEQPGSSKKVKMRQDGIANRKQNHEDHVKMLKERFFPRKDLK